MWTYRKNFKRRLVATSSVQRRKKKNSKINLQLKAGVEMFPRLQGQKRSLSTAGRRRTKQTNKNLDRNTWSCDHLATPHTPATPISPLRSHYVLTYWSRGEKKARPPDPHTSPNLHQRRRGGKDQPQRRPRSISIPSH